MTNDTLSKNTQPDFFFVVIFSERNEPKNEQVKSRDELLSEKCHFLLSQALDADEAGLKDTAVQLYMQSIEMSLNTVC